jgi:predicted Rossmann fold nucleotide-binding protein DprA/Smf involved in DNA uptake
MQRQLPLFPENLSATETQLLDFLTASTEPQSIDVVCRITGISMPQASADLLSLEFSGLVKALPGKVFARV